MKILRRLLPVALAAATVATTLQLLPDNRSRPQPLAVPERDDPHEHADRELMRTRDPMTGRLPLDIRRRELAFASTLPSRDVDALLRASGGVDFDWHQRGPSNVGGRSRALAMDVSSPGTFLAGGVTGGMWRSSDAGLSWRRTTLAAQMPSVTCVAQDTRPGHEETWYYGTGEFRTNSTRFGGVLYSGDGIFKSTDRGVSFTQLPSTVSGTPSSIDQPFDFVGRIVVDPSNLAQDEVYAACVGAIMRSLDGGATWAAALGSFDGATGYTDVAITPDGVVYATIGQGSSSRGVWRSEDGVDWQEITPPNFGDSLRRSSLAIAPSEPGIVYLLAHTPGRGKAIDGVFEVESLSLWRWSDGVWDERSQNIPTLGGAWDYTSLSGYAFFLTVHPTDPDIVLLGGANLFVSTDGFASAGRTRWLGGYEFDWGYGDEGTLHPDQHAAVFDPADPRVLYSGNDGGIYRTNDWTLPRAVWEQRNTGYVTTQFYTVAIDQVTSGSLMISAGAQDNGTLVTTVDDLMSPWHWTLGGDGAFTQIADGGRVRYVSSQYEGLVREDLDEFGNVLEQNFLGGPGEGALFVNPYTLDLADTSVLYYAAGRQLARNTALASMQREWDLLPRTSFPSGGFVSAVASSRANPAHRVWYGTADGRAYVLDDANAGSPTPVQVTGSGFPQRAYINCIAVDPRDGDRAVAVFSNYNVVSLFLTEDGGASWIAIAGNLEERPDGSGSGPSCRWAEFLHTPSGTVLFVGTTTGLYSTTAIDGMSTVWRQEGAATIGNVIVDMIDAREVDGTVAVATWGNGIFSASAIPSGITESSSPGAALLGAPYPNPARASATIPFTVPAELASADVRLVLVDIAGREIAELYAGRPGAGEHRRRIDVSEFPPGSYYCRISVGRVVQTRGLAVGR